MNTVVKILMERDDLTYNDACDRVEEVREMMAECNYDAFECELIIADELGLELDYIFDLM